MGASVARPVANEHSSVLINGGLAKNMPQLIDLSEHSAFRCPELNQVLVTLD